MRRRHVSINDQVDYVKSDIFLRYLAERTLEIAELKWGEINQNLKPQNVLEIGGAGGITKILRPNWLVTDVRNANGVDQVIGLTELPYPDQSFDMVIAIDVLHHIGDFDNYMGEIHRVLKKNGLLFAREPYWSLPAQFIWRLLHPEDFSLRRIGNIQEHDDPMDGNQALAYAILRKSKFIHRKNYLTLFTIDEVGPITGLAFALSGGATFTTKFPRKWLIKLHNVETLNNWWMRFIGMSVALTFRKIDISNTNPH